MFAKLMAHYYDNIMADAEEKCLIEWRQTLLGSLSGKVLEIGAGTGVNYTYYPDTVTHLILTEPSKHMAKKLMDNLATQAQRNVEIMHCPAEQLPFADNSVDHVVSTLVLCSVTDLQQALAELYRVLKPGGKMHFIEHTKARTNPKRYRWQCWLNPIWKHLADGCQLTRDTEAAIHQAGFMFESITHQSMRGVPPVVRPSIRGIALK